MLAVLIARDSYHQNLWLQAIAELEAAEGKITPGSFDRKLEREDIAFSLYNHSASSEESAQGSWANGATPAGDGQFKYESKVYVEGTVPELENPHPSLHSTKPQK